MITTMGLYTFLVAKIIRQRHVNSQTAFGTFSLSLSSLADFRLVVPLVMSYPAKYLILYVM